MSEALARQRCRNHLSREAVARCPECGQFFCRECIVEHEDRVVCAACLSAITARPVVARKQFRGPLRLIAWVAGILVSWLYWFSLGRLLLRAPDSFHNQRFW